MEKITLEHIWTVLVEVKTNLLNHLRHHERADKWLLSLVTALLVIIGGLIIALIK